MTFQTFATFGPSSPYVRPSLEWVQVSPRSSLRNTAGPNHGLPAPASRAFVPGSTEMSWIGQPSHSGPRSRQSRRAGSPSRMNAPLEVPTRSRTRSGIVGLRARGAERSRDSLRRRTRERFRMARSHRYRGQACRLWTAWCAMRAVSHRLAQCQFATIDGPQRRMIRAPIDVPEERPHDRAIRHRAHIARSRTPARRLAGPCSRPGDDEYDEARVVGLGGVDARPAVIVRVAGPDDVRTVIALARETGLELAVRCWRPQRGRALDRRRRDRHRRAGPQGPRRRRREPDGVGRGRADGRGDHVRARRARARDRVRRHRHRSAWPGSRSAAGSGTSSASHGLTIDSLLAAEVVTAAGDVLVADATAHPDLFWALRGGGGNFGVVTRFRFRLHPLAAGRRRDARSCRRRRGRWPGSWRAAADAPDGLSTIANVMPCPPMPFVPEERHGELVILAMVCWSGPVDGRRGGLRAVPGARASRSWTWSGSHAYPEMYPPEDADSTRSPSSGRCSWTASIRGRRAVRSSTASPRPTRR